MSNPVLVEVTRGSLVESRHRGMVVAVDGEGRVVFEAGEIEAPVFPRSACKAMQALPLVESGAADAYGFGNRELALACASHNGEDAHAALAAEMLGKAGQGEEALECGAHWAFDQGPLIHQARTLSRPTALHNNCSGKHAGFVCAACHSGMNFKGYVGYGHPLQQEIRGIMEGLTGAVLAHDNCGTDGCSIPTYAVPLKSLAEGFGRMLTGRGLEPVRARAARRLIEACMAEPFYVAGTRRFCTELMEVAPGKIFAKTGAEGVYCALLPDQGISVALKCEDGAGRAAEIMVAATLARFFPQDSETRHRLAAMADHRLTNWNRIEVGRVRAAGALAV
jgi:L-asparaginase II